MQETERRRTLRRTVDYTVSLFHDGRSVPGETRVLDLSPGGFALVSSTPLRCGESLSFNLALRRGLMIEGTAYIRWLERRDREGGYLHGAEFTALSFFDRQRLGSFLEPDSFNTLNYLDFGLVSAAILVGVFALRDYWSLHPWTEDAAWAVAPTCLVLGLLGWTFSTRLRSRP